MPERLSTWKPHICYASLPFFLFLHPMGLCALLLQPCLQSCQSRLEPNRFIVTVKMRLNYAARRLKNCFKKKGKNFLVLCWGEVCVILQCQLICAALRTHLDIKRRGLKSSHTEFIPAPMFLPRGEEKRGWRV